MRKEMLKMDQRKKFREHVELVEAFGWIILLGVEISLAVILAMLIRLIWRAMMQ
jgi:hypothetical protein